MLFRHCQSGLVSLLLSFVIAVEEVKRLQSFWWDYSVRRQNFDQRNHFMLNYLVFVSFIVNYV